MIQAFNRKESYGNERRQESICPGALTVQVDVGATIRLVLRGSHAFDSVVHRPKECIPRRMPV
jgi:hypothetical protein